MRLSALLLAMAALVVLGLWATGELAALGWWIAARQRALQDALAGEISALRGGGTAALWGLFGLCAAYGFLHALGPGHGKALIAGAAAGTRATTRRMAMIALVGSLAQAGVAIAVVYGGLALLGASARQLTAGAERWVPLVGNLAIAAIGVWILARGLSALRGARAEAHGHRHGDSSQCGHRHGPSVEEAAQATSLGETLALVAGMAARPCTGAMLVLVIAWRMGLAWAGAGAAVAMGLGTAAFTALVAWLAVSSRDAALLSAGSGAARFLAPGLQIVAGGAILAVAGLSLLAALASAG